MNEQTFNTIVGNSLTWYHKISDGGRHGLLPFDGFGVFHGRPVYWESKIIQNPKSFNFRRLEDHQIYNLKKVQELLPDALVFFIVCVNFGRADKRAFVFKDMNYIDRRKTQKENILQKEWISRKNYVTLKKQLINFEDIINMPKEWEYEK